MSEFEGGEITYLNSKVYNIWGKDKEGNFITKTSCKGCQKKLNELLWSTEKSGGGGGGIIGGGGVFWNTDIFF